MAAASSAVIVAFIVIPLVEMMTQPTMGAGGAQGNPDGSGCHPFPGKKLLESIIELPIMIPHPVVGIAQLSIADRNHPIGKVLQSMGV